MKKLLIFASGDAEGGGSGFQKLVEAAMYRFMKVKIVGVVSNHAKGGVYNRAKKLGVPFFYFNGPWTAENYQRLFSKTDADFVALSGWIKKVVGLSPRTTINIHPGPLPAFGGKGMFGHHVHEAVIAAFKRGEIKQTQVCMHFVTEQYDQGPIFFRFNIDILNEDTAETLAARVNRVEHEFQAYFTNRVINGDIFWDGEDPTSLFGAEEWPMVIQNSASNT